MNVPDNTEETGSKKPFVEHLEDLRRVIVGCAISLVLGMIVAAPVAPVVIEILKAPLVKAGQNPDQFLRVLTVAGGFSVAMRTIFWTGLLISLPFMVHQISRFVFPGLTVKERRAVAWASLFSGLLFLGGIAMGYFVAAPVGIQCLLSVNRWIGVPCEFVEFGNYVVFVLQMLICFGVVFELPVILMALGTVGIVSSGQLRKYRRHAVVILMGLAMVLTPSTDIVTMLIMAVPLVALYELCIWLLWWKERKQGRGQKAEG